MKRVAVLGSTGSIGVNALDVIGRLCDGYNITALSADSSIKLLAKQSGKYRPNIISVGNEEHARNIRKIIKSGIKVVCGREGLNEIVSRDDVDIVLFAISGNACIVPLMEAIRRKKVIAMANKEAIVSAGSLIMPLAAVNSVKIIPIDSEHSAIFQCIDKNERKLSKIYLTASGGPLLDVDKKKFSKMAPEFILKHPRWSMGKKITVDSATMMNKGLEIIEARYLFNIDERKIDVLIHPEAIIHSMVEFDDGAVLAQMAVADMRLPIQYALTYPDFSGAIVKRLNFLADNHLSFRAPDVKKFPCLELARFALRSGGTAPAVLCAADEEVVGLFLQNKIIFSRIPEIIENVLKKHRNITNDITLNDILDADLWAREEIRSQCFHR